MDLRILTVSDEHITTLQGLFAKVLTAVESGLSSSPSVTGPKPEVCVTPTGTTHV